MKTDIELCPNIFCSKRNICLSRGGSWLLQCGLKKEFISSMEFNRKQKKELVNE
ncbi:hypothetical protein CIG1485E_a0007 (plasmid) [Campylobacter iguaniorum]|uniref:Uncharacterized protein n=1 Tax=Campylobacter iguaniorum TaxID=1244531 RepID=A0A076FDQ6_9BACT|nr:hypothetical protein CIG1485E_a0007 [Campylobacter iguaniorum]